MHSQVLGVNFIYITAVKDVINQFKKLPPSPFSQRPEGDDEISTRNAKEGKT
jgi:hypothetical protein